MKHFLLVTLLFFFVFGAVNAQTGTATVIKGVVINISTGLPVEYANIGIEGTFIGAASNMDGEFRFNVPASVKDGSIYVSAVGYKTVQLQIVDLPKTESIIIEMHPQSYGIEEVDISAQSLVLYKIIRDVAGRIDDNYINKPFSEIAYYKTTTNINDTIKRVREAAVEIYDATGYTGGNKKQEFDSRKYRFMEVRNDFNVTSLSDGMNQMDELLQFDVVRSRGNILDEDFLRDYDLSLEQVTEYEGDSVWVINYSLENPDLSRTGDYYVSSYQGKLYVNMNGYAVVKNETWITSSNYSRHGRSLFSVGYNDRIPVSIEYKFIVSYRKNNNLYNLAYIKSERKNIWNIPNNKRMVISYDSFLIPTEVKMDNPTVISTRDYFVNKPYNKDFWETFNVIIE
jgi:hypothetical protein